MGTYNPNAPMVLGEEWVGIREESLTFAPGVPNLEVGHQFTLTSSTVLQDARFYLADWPSAANGTQTLSVNIYAAGTEDDSGPVKRVVIPCNNGTVTGSVTYTNATGFADAVASPSDNKYISTTIGGEAGTAMKGTAYFATNSYSAELSGKRILGVNLLYSVGTAAYLRPLEDRPAWCLGITNDTTGVLYGCGDLNGSLGVLTQSTNQSALLPSRLNLGTVNRYWTTSHPGSTNERLPYTYTDLQRFEASASNRLGVYIFGSNEGSTTVTSWIQYLALEVIYCEERRVAVGGRRFGQSFSTAAALDYVLNTNAIPLRTIAEASNPVLTAGDYVVTVALESEDPFDLSESPKLSALRELHAISTHPGVAITRPFPLNDTAVGKQFSSTTTHILPQLSLHTSGGPVTAVHVYGRQAKAPVYGTVTATQEILDSAAGGARSYDQVRFYARRFGDTTVALTVDSPTIAGPSASITPTEFDSLDELVDGWKEITLPLSAAATMGAGTNPQWRWSATGELAGNQWQVLGVSAPALSGTPGNLNTLVPSPHQLSTATYGAPSAGSTINLGWLSPLVTATTDDSTSDAVVLFSMNPPAVSGFAVSVQTQELSTVDPLCFANDCVPTGIYYNQLTWTVPSPPVSGHTGYQLQRYDEVDGEFTTIMESSSPSTASFNDYEARVGIASVYRLRSIGVYDFYGLWSPQITGTVTEPGTDGGGTTLLIFTTNARQDGSSNLAYSSAWEGNPVEEYAWPEAGDVQLQKMYDKDYPTAFRPLERGGETFSRQVLVNAAGIPPAVTARGFQSLRDMAWDTVPYICVRNESGERWYATVIVPSGNVRRMVAVGRLCMANVQIVETSTLPYSVDPA